MEELEADQPEREEVARRRELPGGELLRRGVPGRADARRAADALPRAAAAVAVAGEVGALRHRVWPFRLAVVSREPEIHELDVRALEAAVGRLQVAVHQPADVDVVEAGGDLVPQVERLGAVHAGVAAPLGGRRRHLAVARLQVVAERARLTELHLDEERLAVAPLQPRARHASPARRARHPRRAVERRALGAHVLRRREREALAR